MSITADKGIGTIEWHGGAKIFLGSTAPGQYPPIGHEYDRFVFTPKRGEPGILVFGQRGPGGKMWHYPYQFEWTGDKVVVHSEIKKPTRAYTDSRELGLVVQVRDWYYITGSVPNVRDQNFKRVDLFTMLKYIEGKIDLKELDHNARSYERRQKHIVRMAELQEEIRQLNAEADRLQKNLMETARARDVHDRRAEAGLVYIEESDRRTIRLTSLMDSVLKTSWTWRILRHLPGWLRPKRFDVFGTMENEIQRLEQLRNS